MNFTINNYRQGDKVRIKHFGHMFDWSKGKWFACHYPTGTIESCNHVTVTIRTDSGETVIVSRLSIEDS